MVSPRDDELLASLLTTYESVHCRLMGGNWMSATGGRRRARRRALVVSVSVIVTLALGGCRGLVDDFFGAEQPGDPPVGYGLEFVSARTQPRGTKNSLLYIQTTAPADAYLALRVVDGRIAPLGPESSADDSVACFCVGAGVHQFPILVSGTTDDSSVLFAALFEKSQLANETPPDSATIDPADGSNDATDGAVASQSQVGPLACESFATVPLPECDGGRCQTEEYVFGICPAGVLKVVRARGAVALPATDAAVEDGASDGADAADAATDADADADAIVDAGADE